MGAKTHWKNVGNYDYLGAYSLEGITDEISITISNVNKERVTAAGGKSEDCIVAYFEEAEVDGVTIKPMVLNATNCKTIEKMYGPYIEDWIGKSITVFSTTTNMGRETVPCLRVRGKGATAQPKQPDVTQEAKPKEEHTCCVCGKVIDTRTYNSTMKNFGVAVCSRECYDKYNTNQEESN